MKDIYPYLKSLLLSLPLLLLSCEMKQDVVLDLPLAEQEIIVECYLEPGGEYRALVTKSLDFYQAAQLEGVDTAQIILSSGNEEIKLWNLRQADTLYNKVYNYWNSEIIEYEEGKEYQISISFNGKTRVSGKTRFLPRPEVKNISFSFKNDTTAAALIKVEDDPAEKNFYRVVIRGTNPEYAPTYDETWTDETALNGTLLIETPYLFEGGWDQAVNIFHIEEEYYHFLESVQQARDANYNPFMQPSSINSTLDGATGVFTAISLSTDTVVVK